MMTFNYLGVEETSTRNIMNELALQVKNNSKGLALWKNMEEKMH